MSGNKNSGFTALKRVRTYFPSVDKVVDARVDVRVVVTRGDNDRRFARMKDPTHCAMAHAICRQSGADGAIIGLGSSYVITGNVATRYRTPTAVAREIVSFDKMSGFKAGMYKLSAPSGSQKLLAKHSETGRPHRATHGQKRRYDTVHTSVSYRHI